MDTSDYVNLGRKLDASVAAVRAAAEEDRQQRIDKAEMDAKLALKDTEQNAGTATAAAGNKWAQMKADTTAADEVAG